MWIFDLEENEQYKVHESMMVYVLSLFFFRFFLFSLICFLKPCFDTTESWLSWLRLCLHVLSLIPACHFFFWGFLSCFYLNALFPFLYPPRPCFERLGIMVELLEAMSPNSHVRGSTLVCHTFRFLCFFSTFYFVFVFVFLHLF